MKAADIAQSIFEAKLSWYTKYHILLPSDVKPVKIIFSARKSMTFAVISSDALANSSP